MKYLFLSLFIVFGASCLLAQKQGNIWLFGNNAGLDFNSGTPVPILNSNFGAVEGSASPADKTTGQLLFYTDGYRAFNAANGAMTNGYPLGGNPSGTQSAVVVPKPGSDSIYYLFAVDAEAGDYYNPSNGGVNVNTIDMSLNGGLGAVTARDVLLLAPTTEKCATTLSCNGIDTWVIIHQWNTDAFYAYRVTASGISAPVISHSGIVHHDTNNDGDNGEAQGYMRISNNGKKLALACEYAANIVQLFDFDNSTGVVSNPVSDLNFPTGVSGPYGVCFSPGNTKLYITYNGLNVDTIFQYNMLAGSDSAIIASRTSVGVDILTLGAIQQGPDGKLYCTRVSDSLGVIINPDSLGLACNYVANGISLGGSTHTGLLGLPDVIPNHTGSIAYNPGAVQPQSPVICNGQSVLLTATGGVSYTWSPAISLSSTTGDSVFVNPGSTTTYTVTGVTTGGCAFTDSVVVTVGTGGSLNITAHPDSLCEGNSSTISVTGNTGIIQWQNADSTGTFINIGGADSAVYHTPPLSHTIQYRLVAQSGFCNDTSVPVSVVVLPSPAPPVVIPNDSLICSSDSILLQAPAGYASYLWSDNDTTSFIYAENAGNYWVTVTNNNGCTAVSNEAHLGIYTPTPVTISISGDTLTSYSAERYQWYFDGTSIPGDTTATIIAGQTGTYSVHITDLHGCVYGSSPTNVTVTEIKDLQAGVQIKIYPNPLPGGNWHMDVSEMLIGAAYEVFDADGKIVYKGELKSAGSEIFVDVAAGVYLMQIHSAQLNYNVKLIKLN